MDKGSSRSQYRGWKRNIGKPNIHILSGIFFEFRYSKVMQRQIFIFLNMLKSDILLLISAVMFECFVIHPLTIFPKKEGGVPGVTPLNPLDKVMHSSYNWTVVLSWICIQTLIKKNPETLVDTNS